MKPAPRGYGAAVAIKERRSTYAVALDGEGRVAAEGNDPVAFGGEWTPEHLVLAALARCSVAALRHHARKEALELRADARARGVIGRREDGSWGFLEIACEVDASLRPEPDADAVADLLARAERGCFIGASLAPAPAYRWTVNGRPAGR